MVTFKQTDKVFLKIDLRELKIMLEGKIKRQHAQSDGWQITYMLSILHIKIAELQAVINTLKRELGHESSNKDKDYDYDLYGNVVISLV